MMVEEPNELIEVIDREINQYIDHSIQSTQLDTNAMRQAYEALPERVRNNLRQAQFRQALIDKLVESRQERKEQLRRSILRRISTEAVKQILKSS